MTDTTKHFGDPVTPPGAPTPAPGGLLEISWDDLSSTETTEGVARLREAQSVPLVRQVGTPDDATVPWHRHALAQAGLAGLLGGLLTWLMVETLMSDAWSTTTTNVTFTIYFAVGIGLMLVLWDAITARSGDKFRHDLVHRAPVVLGLSVVAGFIISELYSTWMTAIYERLYAQGVAGGWDTAEFYDALLAANHLPRGVAWALVGIAIGAGVGLAYRKSQRAINGIIGGAFGGFVAGYAFDYFTGGVAARGFGILFTGVAIGVAIGLVEQARRQHWLEIQTGGLAGKQFILYGGATTVGSDPSCDVTLIKDPAIAPQHLTLTAGDSGLRLLTAPGAPVHVNGQPVTERDLADGDQIALGSTLLRYRDKSEVAIPTGPIIG